MIPGTSSTAGRAGAVPYDGLSLDRATGRRADSAWVASLTADPRARVRPLWRDQCLVTGEPPAPGKLPVGAIAGPGPAGLVLLGLDGGAPDFAVDLSDLPLEDALRATGATAA